MRVLWLTKGLGPGGAERLLVEQAHALRDVDGFEFEAAYLLPWKNHLVPELEALGVPTHCLGVENEADLRWLSRLRSLARRRDYAVVHAHSPLSASLARVMNRTLRPRAAFVYTEHNRWPSYHWATRAANASTFLLNDAVIAVSDDVRASIPAPLRTRVETVVHGIDVAAVRAEAQDRAAVRSEFGIGDDELLAVTIANLRHGKGYPVLLDAAAQLLWAGAPVRFLAVGQGPVGAELRARLEQLGLGDGFRVLGYRADARRILA